MRPATSAVELFFCASAARVRLHCHTFLFFLRKITIFSYPTAPLFLPLILTVASITDGAGISISTVNEGSGPGAEVSTTIQTSIH